MLEQKPIKKENSLVNFFLIIVIAVLSALVGYFYTKSRGGASKQETQTTAAGGAIALNTTTLPAPTTSTAVTTAINTKDSWQKLPAKPREIYLVQKGDTLFPISKKYGLDWIVIAQANGLTNPDEIKIDQNLVIPVLEEKTKLPGVEFIINPDALAKLNAADYEDPIAAAKNNLNGLFGITPQDEFTLKSKADSAVVDVVHKEQDKTANYQITLTKSTQPVSSGTSQGGKGWENSWLITKITAQ